MDMDTLVADPAAHAPVDAAEASTVASKSGGEPEVWDFRGGSRVGGSRLRALRAMHEIFSDSLAHWMSAKLRTEIRVHLDALEERTFTDVVGALEKPCAAYLYEVPGKPGISAMFAVAPEVGFVAVDRLLGGSTDPLIPERGFTMLEARVVGLVVDRVREGIEEMWLDHAPFVLKFDRFESFPDMLRFAQPDEAFLVSRLVIQSEAWSSFITVHLPFALLEEGLDAGGSVVDADPAARQAIRRQLESHLLEAKVVVDARLPDFPVSLGQLATLRPGVVLATRIPVDAPVEVSVCGQKRFMGSAGRLGADLAVRIQTPMSGRPES